MKKLIESLVIFVGYFLISCGNLPTDVKFINALNGIGKVSLNKISEDCFVGDWYPVKPLKSQGTDRFSITCDGENYIQRTNRFEINNGISRQLLVKETIYSKKNDLLLVPVEPILSGMGILLRYDKNSRHIVISSTLSEPVEFYKNGDPY